MLSTLPKINHSFLLISCLLLAFTSFSISSQTLSQTLKELEKLSYSNESLASAQLKSLELQLGQAANAEKLRWMMLSIQLADRVKDTAYKKYLAQKVPFIIQHLHDDTKTLWQTVLNVTFKMLNREHKGAIETLQTIEKEVAEQEDKLLHAYFNHILYYAFVNNNVIDVAIDIAIENIKQWQTLEEYYFALEMDYQLTYIRATVLEPHNSRQLIASFSDRAKQLHATRYEILLSQIEAASLMQTKDFEQAYILLNNLITEEKVTAEDGNFPELMLRLSSLSYELGNVESTIESAQKVLAFTALSNTQTYNYAKILLAKGLIQKQDFEQAKQVLNEANDYFLKTDDSFSLFEIDLASIELFYRSGDIDALYRSSSGMIDKLTQLSSDNQGHRRLERAEKAVRVKEQEKIVEVLATDNENKSQKIAQTTRQLQAKSDYLTMMIIFCSILLVLFVWVVYLLRRVRKLANTDSLTGARNRRSGIEKTTKLIKRARQNRQKGEIAIAMMDLDDFKSINDTYGHDVGDRVIKNAVNKVNGALDKNDIICRMGGEEFLIVLNNKSKQQIKAQIEKIRTDIFQTKTSELGVKKPVSASIGITTVTGDETKSVSEYIVDADTALYDAKHNGKNQVSFYQKTA